MIQTDSTCRINGLLLVSGSFRCSPDHQTLDLQAEYALAEVSGSSERALGQVSKSKVLTHGRCLSHPVPTTGVQWSRATVDLLRQLLQQMEEDLLRQHFDRKELADARTEPEGHEEVDQV